ncbi:MAG: hypothetical protein V2A74_05375, partial [bacterium]
ISFPTPNTSGVITISTDLRPISEGAESAIAMIREFGPTGLTFGGDGGYIRFPWKITDLLTDNGVLDESAFLPTIKVGGQFVEIPSSDIIQRNVPERYLIFRRTSFQSTYGLKGDFLPQPTAVAAWPLYE